jgi:hypothetical protein
VAFDTIGTTYLTTTIARLPAHAGPVIRVKISLYRETDVVNLENRFAFNLTLALMR